MQREQLSYEADGLTLRANCSSRRRRAGGRRAGVSRGVRARRACPGPRGAAGGDGLCRAGQRPAWRRPAGRRAGGGDRAAAAVLCRPVADTGAGRRRPRRARARPEVDAGRIAAIGFCFGGTMALELARSGADIKAVVGFHSGLGAAAPERRQGHQGQGAGLHRRRRPVHPAGAAGRVRGRDARRPGSTGRCTSMAGRCTASPTLRRPSATSRRRSATAPRPMQGRGRRWRGCSRRRCEASGLMPSRASSPSSP